MWVLSIVIAVFVASVSCQWAYEDGTDGPHNWIKYSKDCGENRQSPINIPLYADSHNVDFPVVIRNDVYSSSLRYVISKDNYSVSIFPHFENGPRASISGGPLTGKYLLDHIHFHWGDSDSYGSEHTFANKPAALEMHAVHYNEKYPDVTVASAHPDGLAVVGYLFEVKTGAFNTELLKVTTMLPFIQSVDPSASTSARKLDLADLLVPFDGEYATYLGSLTTPPCSETVTWIVHNKMQTISRIQMMSFRDMYKSTPTMRNNFRPVQNLNGRNVIYKTLP